MISPAKTAAGDGLPDDFTYDWDKFAVRLARIEFLLGLEPAEANVLFDETGEELTHAIVEFCRRNEVSLDWLVLGEGPVMTEKGRPNIDRVI